MNEMNAPVTFCQPITPHWFFNPHHYYHYQGFDQLMCQLQTTKERNFLDRLNDGMNSNERRILAIQVVAHLHDNEFIMVRHGEKMDDDYARKFVMLFFQGVPRKTRNLHGD